MCEQANPTTGKIPTGDTRDGSLDFHFGKLIFKNSAVLSTLTRAIKYEKGKKQRTYILENWKFHPAFIQGEEFFTVLITWY